MQYNLKANLARLAGGLSAGTITEVFLSSSGDDVTNKVVLSSLGTLNPSIGEKLPAVGLYIQLSEANYRAFQASGLNTEQGARIVTNIMSSIQDTQSVLDHRFEERISNCF